MTCAELIPVGLAIADRCQMLNIFQDLVESLVPKIPSDAGSVVDCDIFASGLRYSLRADWIGLVTECQTICRLPMDESVVIKLVGELP
jgi:hypothetical protein